MAIEDKLSWNTKHLERDPSTTPSETLSRFLPRAESGSKKALDIACGMGRHCRYMAQQGYLVDAVDISDVAVGHLRHDANISTHLADLDTYFIPRASYDVIINFYYLNRRLTPLIHEGLKAGGMVFFETFVEDSRLEPESFGNKDHYLRPNELLHMFIGLRVVYYEEKLSLRRENEEAMLASLVAVKE